MSEAIAVSIKFDKNLSKLFEQAALKAPYAVGKAIDEVGNKTKTQVIKAVAKQAGIPGGARAAANRVKSVIHSKQAMGAGRGEYQIIARDVTLSLKEFGPKKTPKGVSAAPWGKRQVFDGSFIATGGHVFVRTTKGGKTHRGPRPAHAQLPIRKLWGPSIPREMVKDEAEATFYRNVDHMLSPAIEKWLMRQIG